MNDKKEAKMLLIIKNCSIELAKRIQKTINEYNAALKKQTETSQ